MLTLTKRIQAIRDRLPRTSSLYGALSGLWVVFIGVVSLLPSSQLSPFESWNFLGRDKVAHILVYAVLSFFLGSWYLKHKTQTPSVFKFVCLILIPTALYGALLEWMQQTFQPGRFAELADMVANSLGAGLGIIVVLILFRKDFHFPEWPKE